MVYDQYKGKKHLIFYEDLITKPKETLFNLLIKLNENTGKLKNFMNNYEYHKNNAINIYSSHISPSMTRGEKKSFHYNQLNNMQKKYFEDLINTRYLDLKNKYLTKYND